MIKLPSIFIRLQIGKKFERFLKNEVKNHFKTHHIMTVRKLLNPRLLTKLYIRQARMNFTKSFE